MKIKIEYNPTGINNFHNCDPIKLIIDIDNIDNIDEEIEISKNQKDRINRHFCGVKECHCPAGAVTEFEYGRYSIMSKWIEVLNVQK